MLSLRCLSIALSLSCVCIGSFVAAFLAIQSGDDALSITKSTGGNAVDQCFATASESVVLQTNALIDALMGQSVMFLDNFLKVPINAVEILTKQLDELPPEKALDWPYLEANMMPELWALMHTYRGQITGLGIQNAKGQLLWVIEHDATVYAPDNAFHLFNGFVNNGTDYGPAEDRTLMYDMGPGGRPANNTNDWVSHFCFSDNWSADRARLQEQGKPTIGFGGYDLCYVNPNNPDPFFCGNTTDAGFRPILDPNTGQWECWCIPLCDPALHVPGQKARDMDGCPHIHWASPRCVILGYGPFTGVPFDFWLLGALLTPKGTVNWSPPLAVSTYLGLVAVGPYGHPDAMKPPYNAHTAVWGGKVGIAWVGVDLRTMSNFLQNLVLPGLSRLFLVLFMDVTGATIGEENRGYLVAASHGTVSLGSLNTVQEFIYPVNSSDAVVAGTAAHILDTGGGNTLIDMQGYEEFFNRTGRPGGEPAEFSVDLPSSITAGRPSGVQRFFLKVVRYVDPQQKLGLWVVMSFDRYVILGAIDRKQEETKEGIAAANKKVDDQLEEDRMLLYIVVAAVAVGMIIVSVIFVVAIVQPLNMLGSEMDEVACMRLDGVTEKLSSLSEVARCQIAFLAMVRALRKYRDYMPLSLLQDDDEEEEEEEAPTEAKSAESLKDSRQGTAPDGQNEEPRRSSAEKSAAGTRQSGGTEATRRKKNAAEKTSKGIGKKQASVVMIGVKGFHDALRGSDADIVSTHTDLFFTIVEAVGETKAVPDTFNGDRIMVSFGAVKAAPGHRVGCGTLSDNIRQKLDRSSWWKVSGVPVASVVIGTATGEVRCGNVGCSGMMRFTLFGKALSWGWALQRFAQSLTDQGGTHIFCDHWLAAELTHSFQLRTVALVKFPKRFDDTIVLSQMMAKREVSEDEWMYQLEEGAKADPYTAWNDAVTSAKNEKLDEVKQHVEAVLQANPSLQGTHAQRWQCILAGKGDLVAELRYH
eukprot:TRINITY_DN3781_c0_g2_i2.p1 TRINITY_DN3781_c0_g2~~TRINITY_DN3781_c0_g2_i2.p1  ORF type:complete len:1012 (+),score=246.06 TRINITY_DN3781_c0_g2_i2:98-3037(+)